MIVYYAYLDIHCHLTYFYQSFSDNKNVDMHTEF